MHKKLKRIGSFQPQWYIELYQRVRAPCIAQTVDNDIVIDYALEKAYTANRSKQRKEVMEQRKKTLKGL